MINKNTLLYLFLFISVSLQAQTSSVGNWLMFFNQIRLHEKWSVNSDIQFRSYNVVPNTEQVMLRTGINYLYNPNISFAFGYARVTNYANNETIANAMLVSENRIWEQVALRNTFGRFLIEHRYRLEQRWLKTKATETIDYKNRIRYLFRVIIPMNKKELVKNTFYTSLYNEVFIHVNKTAFDRNRLYGAVGFQFSSLAAVQLGYLLQTVNNTSKSYLQVGLHYNVDLRKN